MERKNIFYRINERLATLRQGITRRDLIISILLIAVGVLIGWLITQDGQNGRNGQIEEVHEHVPDEDGETIWTCAMHPQIRQPEPGDCPICGMDLVPLEEAEMSESPVQLTMTEEAVKLADIQTIEVTTGEAAKKLMLTGMVEISEERIAEVSAEYNARIEALHINFKGEYVAQGQVLAHIYSPDLLVAQKELLKAAEMREHDPELYQAARNKLRLWELTEHQVDEVIRSGKVDPVLEIISPVSGIVTERHVKPGDHVKKGDVLFDVANLGVVWIMFDVYEKDLSWINTGDNIRFTVPSMPGEIFSGSVSFIDPLIDPDKRVAEVRVEAVNPDGKLKPRMFARGELYTPLSGQKGGLKVPKSSVLWTGKRSVVYVKLPGTTIPAFEFREVLLGAELDDHYIIEEGLAYGEEVVIHGAFTIDAAAQLNNKASMMNRNVVVRDQEVMLEQEMTFTAPEKFRNQLNGLVNVYLDLKNALVNVQENTADKHMRHFKGQLAEMDESLLRDDALEYWEEKERALQEHIEIHFQADGLEEKKENFGYLSQAMVDIVEAYGSKQLLYVDYCPMAMDNRGGYWLSETEEIRNPFMPETMLQCGEVKDIINPGDAAVPARQQQDQHVH